MIFYLWDLLVKNMQPQSNHEENIKQIPAEGHFNKKQSSIPQHCQGYQNQKV